MIENAVILMPTVSWGVDLMPYTPFLPMWAVALIIYGAPLLGVTIGFFIAKRQ